MTDYLGVLRTHELFPASTVCAIVTGSVARGWAHGASDIDLVVISSDRFADDRLSELGVALDPDKLGVAAFNHEGRRWEVKYWLDDQVDQLFEKVTWSAFAADRNVGSRLPEPEELFLSRLDTCIPMLGAEWIDRRREQLAGSAFRSLMTLQALNGSDDASNAAMGQLMAGEIDGAVLAARQAFGWSVEALLISLSEYNVGLKWRPRRFRAAAPKLLSYEEYWAIESMQDFAADRAGEWITTVVSLCKDLSMKIEV